MYIHRKSEEQSPTKIECYWKKPKLSSVGTTLKCIIAKSLSKKRLVDIQNGISVKTFFNDMMKLGKDKQINCQVGAYNYDLIESSIKMLSIHKSILEFTNQYTSNILKQTI